MPTCSSQANRQTDHQAVWTHTSGAMLSSVRGPRPDQAPPTLFLSTVCAQNPTLGILHTPTQTRPCRITTTTPGDCAFGSPTNESDRGASQHDPISETDCSSRSTCRSSPPNPRHPAHSPFTRYTYIPTTRPAPLREMPPCPTGDDTVTVWRLG